MRTIRTTMQPGTEIEVSEKEYLDLSRQGLVLEQPDEPNIELTPAALAEAASRLDPDEKAPGKTTTPKSEK